MLQKKQRKWCYFIVCIMLMAGIHTTYIKADSFAGRVASIEAANSYTAEVQRASVTLLKGTDGVESLAVCVVERMNVTARALIGRIASRTSRMGRELRFSGVFSEALCEAFFLLQCCLMEEILCLLEKKNRTALIKYIHDIDGKKKISCLA